MFKKQIRGAVLLLAAAALTVQAGWNSDITMLLVPRDVIPIQIAQDVAQRYPVLIVSYQQTPAALKLYAWDGKGWVFVTAEDYTNGTFFATPPRRAVLIESERAPAPAAIIPVSSWCKEGSRISSTDPRVLLHLLGRHFDFPYRHWEQLAKRYGYSMEQINPAQINVNWWHIRGDRLAGERAKRDFSRDMDKWHRLDLIPPPAVEPVVVEAPKEVPQVEVPAAEPVEPAKPVEPVKTDKAPVQPRTDAVKTPAVNPAPEKKPEAESLPEPAPLAEPAPSVAPEPSVAGADPFSAEDIPAAGIVTPVKKKPWWKLF
jgi:hypothetical protein